MTRIRLPGPDGRKLLGFLATLGAFKALASRHRQPALSWGTDFRPVLHCPADGEEWSEKRLLDELEDALRTLAEAQRFRWDRFPNKVTPEMFRAYTEEALSQATPRHRDWVDFATGLGSDIAHDPHRNRKGVMDTALRTMSGAGNQHFLDFMKQLQKSVNKVKLREALFEPWAYRDEGLSLRWDEVDDRRYALRAENPAGSGKQNKIHTVHGANRLAFEALALLPPFPVARGLETTGFSRRSWRAKEPVFHWPLWAPPVTLDPLRGLLGHPAIPDRDREWLPALGVFAVLSSRRFTEGRYRNFAPAEIWPVSG